MEKVNFGYLVKNIPCPDERNYKMKLLEQMESFVKRMRWKAIFFNSRKDTEMPENYGLKITKCPEQVKELIQFENDLLW